jgi:hypothetical protein
MKIDLFVNILIFLINWYWKVVILTNVKKNFYFNWFHKSSYFLKKTLKRKKNHLKFERIKKYVIDDFCL